MRADVAAGRVLGRLLEVAEANMPGVLDDLDTEFLHDLRVSIRRARSVLRELQGVHPEATRRRLRAELRWAQALTSRARDLDVQLLEWDHLAGGLGDDAGDLEPLRALLVQRRKRETALHDLRKRGKELRYLLELFGGLFPRTVVRPMVATLKDLQDVLGRFQDRGVQTTLLRESVDALAARARGPEAVLAAGRLIAWLEDDQRCAREAFGEPFEAFASSEQRRIVRKAFAKAVEA